MSIVAHVHPYVVGVDTHARHHVYSVLVSSTGELLGSQKFPTTEAGLKRAMRWVVHRTRSHVEALWVIEGTSSYGAVLTGMVLASDFSVAEAPRVVLILSIVPVWGRLMNWTLQGSREQHWGCRWISCVGLASVKVFVKQSGSLSRLENYWQVNAPGK